MGDLDAVVRILMGSMARLLDEADEKYRAGSVEGEVKILQKDLVSLQSFLKDSKGVLIEVHKEVDRIREVAGEAEDAVDKYMANKIIELRGTRNYVASLKGFLSRGKRSRHAANKVKSVRNMIDLIYNNYVGSISKDEKMLMLEHKGKNIVQENYDPGETSSKQMVEGEVSEMDNIAAAGSCVATRSSSSSQTPEEEEEDRRRRWQRRSKLDRVVGFKHETRVLVCQLVEGDPRLDVVSITGAPGSGKTTLASKIYNHRRVNNHFDCQAWVFASQKHCKTKDYLLDIFRCLMSSVPEEMDRVSNLELKLTLRAFLREKRYLVVLDDLHTTQVWDMIRGAFPNSFNGSRLLVTSTKQVDLFATQAPPYYLSSLDEDASWKLFCNKVHPTIHLKDEPGLEDVGKQVVQSCKGHPLAIVVLGGLVANKKVELETWSRLIEDIRHNYSQNTLPSDILQLSYRELPPNLISCFLQLGVFPINSEISVRYLINFWIAEGFVLETNQTKALEDIAEDYLEELSARSLIQITKRRADGGAKTCRMHDLLCQLSISESYKVKFLEVIDSESNPASIGKGRRVSMVTNRIANRLGLIKRRRFDPLIIRKLSIIERVHSSKTRRLSIRGDISEYISSHPNVASRAHSLLLFGHQENEFENELWTWIFNNFEFLRVLCLEKLSVVSIPKNIENLVFLRYLRIWNEKLMEIDAIPDSICNLQFLEGIDINGHVEECLPKDIWSMKRLRNLRFSDGFRLPTPGSNDKASFKLQILSCVLVDETTKLLMPHLRFPNLRKLHLKYDHGVAKMNEFEIADVLESLRPKEKEDELGSLKEQECLKIIDFPLSEPRLNLFSSTIVKMTFQRSYFNSSHFKILAKLPNLEILKLKGKFPYYGVLGPLRCGKGDFPKLQVFQMIDLEIEIWLLESGAMEKLEQLVICKCYRLRNMSEVLAELPALRLVEVSQMSQSFTKILMEMNFSDECKLLIDCKPHKSDTNPHESDAETHEFETLNLALVLFIIPFTAFVGFPSSILLTLSCLWFLVYFILKCIPSKLLT